jgi:hypothetical protein
LQKENLRLNKIMFNDLKSMKARTYILIFTIAIIAALIFHSWHSKPATDLRSLAKVMRATTSEPVFRVAKLDNEGGKFMVTNGSAAEQHFYVMVWSG